MRLVEDKVETIAYHFEKIMEALGLDTTDSSLKKTPQRVAKMYVEELFSGLDPKNFPSITTFDLPDQPEEGQQVVSTSCHFSSCCEHHFVPIIGRAHIAYIPETKWIGLSKIPRIVNYYAKRPQVQERLTKQIHSALTQILETPHVAVILKASHACCTTRGVEDPTSTMRTSHYSGDFLTKPELRKEVL